MRDAVGLFRTSARARAQGRPVAGYAFAPGASAFRSIRPATGSRAGARRRDPPAPCCASSTAPQLGLDDGWLAGAPRTSGGGSAAAIRIGARWLRRSSPLRLVVRATFSPRPSKAAPRQRYRGGDVEISASRSPPAAARRGNARSWPSPCWVGCLGFAAVAGVSMFAAGCLLALVLPIGGSSAEWLDAYRRSRGGRQLRSRLRPRRPGRLDRWSRALAARQAENAVLVAARRSVSPASLGRRCERSELVARARSACTLAWGRSSRRP